MHGTWHSGPEDNITVHYQFKTFIRAAAVDTLIFKTLHKESWDLAWVSSGEWGSYTSAGPKWTKEETVFFLTRLAAAYPGIALISADSSYTAPCRFFMDATRAWVKKTNSRFFFFEERDIVVSGAHNKIPELHGHLGTMTDTIVRAVFAGLCGL